MKKNIVTLITIYTTFHYVVKTLINIDIANRKVLLTFLVFIFPTVFRQVLLGVFLAQSLFHKAKDIDNRNFTALVSLLGTNLSVFVGIFVELRSPNLNQDLSLYGMVFSLLIVPFYLVGLFTLGKNLTVLPEANTLNTKGIYSISRHPLYLCYIIWFVFQNLIYQTWLLLLISIVQIGMLIMRAKYEEELLTKNFPEYKEYRETVMWFGRRKTSLSPGQNVNKPQEQNPEKPAEPAGSVKKNKYNSFYKKWFSES